MALILGQMKARNVVGLADRRLSRDEVMVWERRTTRFGSQENRAFSQ
jgi:hypothetical protein